MNFLSFIISSISSTQTASSSSHKLSDVANGLPIEQVVDKLVSSAVDLVLRLVIAIVVFYLGKLIINKIYKSVNKILHRRQVDRSLATFVLSLVKIVMLFILIIISISILGIETSSFIALFASAGVAVGMALSGTLQNFAGGVLILLLKPYKVDDFIEFQGFTGKVKEIQIFNTILNTGDNKWISIPNGGLSTGSINNYSREDYRRIDWTISIAYGDNYEVAKREILRIVNEDDRIVKKYIEDDRAMRFKDSDVSARPSFLPDIEFERHHSRLWKMFHRKKNKSESQQEQPAEEIRLAKTDCSPFVALSALAASSVDVVVRVWAPTSLYWNVYFDMNARFYNELPKVGINFPFPQMDVHMN